DRIPRVLRVIGEPGSAVEILTPPVRATTRSTCETTVPSVRFDRAGGRNRSHSPADSTLGRSTTRHQSEPEPDHAPITDSTAIRHEQRNQQGRKEGADGTLHNAGASRQSERNRERYKRRLQTTTEELLVPSLSAELRTRARSIWLWQ